MLKTNNCNEVIHSIIFEKKKAPIGFFRKSSNRIQIVRFLVEHCLQRKDENILKPLSVKDFKDYNLYSFLTSYYNCSPKKALQEAYKEKLLDKNIFSDPFLILASLTQKEIKEPPRGFWTSAENRILTIKYLIDTVLESSPYEVKSQDFIDFGLGGFLAHYYHGSLNKAILEAYPQAKVFLFKRVDSKIWQDETIRREAIRFYIKDLPVEKIDFKLLKSVGVKQSLIAYYDNNLNNLISDLQKA